MDKNCISALIAKKTIEALYGKVSHSLFHDEDGNLYMEREWNFSSCDLSNYIKEREEILQNLDKDAVKTELQIRYDAYWYSDTEFSISAMELNELVMWTQNGFITYYH